MLYIVYYIYKYILYIHKYILNAMENTFVHESLSAFLIITFIDYVSKTTELKTELLKKNLDKYDENVI